MSSPARPRTDRRRTGPATRSDLLEATKRLLAGGAPVATLRVDQIVAEAGMGRATFYLHFKDKSELMAALAEDQVAWRDQIGAEVLADPKLTRESVHLLMRTIVGQWAENWGVLAAIIEVAEYDAAMATIWKTSMGEVTEKAAEQFRRRWESRPGQSPDPDMIAELFTWMFERSCHQILRDPSRVDAAAAGMTDIIWRVLDYRA
ncbi:TetR/AcrR family transcriptional regulator [Sporichthya polymorpha]|uniref:TetR/AcrR family transcriptional regulator n=1 Tax=Sporichthya polymorpha TaxID=35751 RepID=UPI00036FFF37|nr:TetR/AcrR family transcriptional regulator [Sporichthya polymorpha]